MDNAQWKSSLRSDFAVQAGGNLFIGGPIDVGTWQTVPVEVTHWPATAATRAQPSATARQRTPGLTPPAAPDAVGEGEP